MKLTGIVLREKEDSTGEIIKLDGAEWENPVPVSLYFGGEVVGYATLVREEVTVKAEITVLSTDRLTEDFAKRMVPAIGGRIVEIDEDGNINECRITEIAFGESNTDPSIGPMKIEEE